MSRLPPLTTIMDRGAESGGEFERLMNQLLLCFADRQGFEYEPAGGAGGDSGIDGLARRGRVPGFDGPVAFQFKWLWDGLHKSSKARQVVDALNRAGQFSEIRHWVLVTPHDLTPTESDWLHKRLSPREGLTLHHWGQARIEGLLRDYCPALFARYYPHEAKPSLAGYDGHDFRQFATDYRRKVAIAYRRLRTIGLPPETLREQDVGFEIPLRQIFVPQRFAAEEADEESRSLAELLEARQSCMLLGDPGMGKTTALSFVALLHCGEADLKDYAPPAEVVPLLIPIRDFLLLRQEKPELDFLEYLAHRARTDLSLPHAHRAFFEATLRMGEALVLVDGLDEAGSDVIRQRVANMIQTFQAEFPECPCWGTSRVYGYTQDVRLPKDVFAHYRVGRLKPEQINEFVASWYKIQNPENPRERAERVASLQDAVQRTPGVQRLAGNPLLLTLMAFIHHGQRALPQDRGELYEQCVQMLLKTWQEAKHEGRPAVATNRFEELGLYVATQKDYLAHLAMFAEERNQAADEDEGRGLIRREEALDCLAHRHLDRCRRNKPEMELAQAREEMEHFLDYVRDRTGLLIDKGGGQISFIHLSFQEYLAAWLFCCQASGESEQRKFYESHLGQPAWEEVLLLRLYVILHLPGGGGENLFDAVVSGLLRQLERQDAPAGWLTLARAVRDNLDFSARDRKAILQRIIDYWLATPPRFEGQWFNVLEEVCLFSPQGKNELGVVLDEGWRSPELPRSVACLHLVERLGFSKGEDRISERPDVIERMSDLFVEQGTDPGWRYTLGFLFRSVIGKLGPKPGLGCLRHVAQQMQLPPVDPARRGQESGIWKLAILLGDCLQILVELETALPDELTQFFQACVFHAIEQEIAVKDRNTLAVALGHLGDPRVVTDLRNRAAYAEIPTGRYQVGGDRTAWNSLEKATFDVHKPFLLSKYPVTNSQYALFVDGKGYQQRHCWSEAGWKWRTKNKIEEPESWQDGRWNAPNKPVVGVSYWEAEAFANWVRGRLPSERSGAASEGAGADGAATSVVYMRTRDSEQMNT